MLTEGTGTRYRSSRECPAQLKDLTRTARGLIKKIPQTPGEPSFAAVVQPGSKVVCLVTGVSPRKSDEGYEKTSDKAAEALASRVVCRTCAGRAQDVLHAT
jgi:hypothetical protein